MSAPDQVPATDAEAFGLAKRRRLVFWNPVPAPGDGEPGDGDGKPGDGDGKPGDGDDRRGRDDQPTPPEVGKVGACDVWRFRSLTSFLHYGEHRPTTVRTAASRREARGGEDWHGPDARTWPSTKRLILRGWADGARRCEAVAAAAAPAGATEEHRPLDVVGDAVELGAYLAGEPECMHTPAPARTVPVVALVVQAGGSCGVDPERFIQAGGAVLAAVRAIEASGAARVRIVCTWRAIDTNKRSTLVVCEAKAPEESADGADVAFLVAHPAALRRLVFAVNESLPDATERGYHGDGGGYGSPGALPVDPAQRDDLRAMLGMRGPDGTDTGELAVIVEHGAPVTNATCYVLSRMPRGPWGKDVPSMLAHAIVEEVGAACAAWAERGELTHVMPALTTCATRRLQAEA